MKYPYPDIETITYDDKRWYNTPHGYYPSITTILGFTEAPEKKASLKRWQDSLGPALASAKSKAATDRGTMVHLLAERYLKKEQVDAPVNGVEVSQADKDSFAALKLKLDKIDEVWGQEAALYSTSLEIAGRCDLIGVYRGIPCIVDFKTASRIKGHKDIDNYKLQLQMYGTAHNEMFGTDIQHGFILMVAETGFPMEFKVPFTDQMQAELHKKSKMFWDAALSKA